MLIDKEKMNIDSNICDKCNEIINNISNTMSKNNNDKESNSTYRSASRSIKNNLNLTNLS